MRLKTGIDERMCFVSSYKLTNPSVVKQIIDQYEFRFKKRFGQNFIIDRNILNKIIKSAELKSDKYVIEIGTGLGTLTYELAKRCKQVITFEIDHELAKIFTENNETKNIELICEDALKANWRQILVDFGWQGEAVSLAANLPYYITSGLIMKALECELPFDLIVVMVQKEVADRIRAKPGTKEYGLLTLAVEYYAEVELIANVPRTVFMPEPDVDSAIIRLIPHQSELGVEKEKLFAVMRGAFMHRRKTLKNSLKRLCKDWGVTGKEFDQILQELNLRSDVRGEVLSLALFGEITKKLAARAE